MRVQVSSDGTHASWIERGAATLRRYGREERNHEEGLLGRIEVVDEEVAVDVPAAEVLRRVGFALAGGRAEVNDEGVAPLTGGGVDAILQEGTWKVIIRHV